MYLISPMTSQFEHERIKPAVIRTSEGNVTNLAHLKQIVSVGMLV